ncbi:MAG: efflux RND transporter periplasmic adaptor subunit [Acetobacteraceae bacterium]
MATRSLGASHQRHPKEGRRRAGRSRTTASFATVLVIALLLGLPCLAMAAKPAAPPPTVGVVIAKKEPVYTTHKYVGRILARKTVRLVARVTGVLEQRLFKQGSDVGKGDLLYVIEQPPFQAVVAQQQAAIAQAEAQLTNAIATLDRSLRLLHTPAGQQSTVDSARAAQLGDAAQLASAKAQLEIATINLGYTEIRAPLAGRIGVSGISTGNVVGPSSGTLATIVSQDPMYIAFEMPVVDALALNDRYRAAGGLAALALRIILPNGKTYPHQGKVSFMGNTVSSSTDTILVRGTIANPVLPGAANNGPANQGIADRALTDGEFVTVIVQEAKPEERVVVPRQAILYDQLGTYALVVGPDAKVERRAVTLGQSTPETAIIESGVKAGEQVITEGMQRVRPGLTVEAKVIAAAGSMAAAAGKS